MAIDHSTPAGDVAGRAARPTGCATCAPGGRSRLEATPAPSGQEEEWRRTSLDGLPWDAGPPRLPDGGHLRPAISSCRCRRHLQRPGHRRRRAAGAGAALPGPTRNADLRRRISGRWPTPRGSRERFCTCRAASRSTRRWSRASTLAARRRHSPSAWSWPRRGAASPCWRRSTPTTAWPPGSVASPTWWRVRGARVRYASLQRLGDAAWHVGAQRVEVGQDAEVITLNAEIGSATTKLGVDVR